MTEDDGRRWVFAVVGLGVAAAVGADRLRRGVEAAEVEDLVWEAAGSAVRPGPRLRPPDEGQWVPFGRSPIVTGMRVRMRVWKPGSDVLYAGDAGTVTRARDRGGHGVLYGVDFESGDRRELFLRKNQLLRLVPRAAEHPWSAARSAQVQLVHKISQSPRDTFVLAVAPGDLDDRDTILRWLRGNGQDVDLARSRLRVEPDGRLVLILSRGSSYHSVIMTPILPSGSPQRIPSSQRLSSSKPLPKVLEQKLRMLRTAMEEVWSCETAFGDCRVGKPSAGHCMMAAMVVQDLCGGVILHTKVGEIPHYWSRIGGCEVDLTADQFGGPPIRVGRDLYPGSEVFERRPGESLAMSLNAKILGLHRRFVDALVPAMRRQGLGPDATRIRQIVDGWP